MDADGEQNATDNLESIIKTSTMMDTVRQHLFVRVSQKEILRQPILGIALMMVWNEYHLSQCTVHSTSISPRGDDGTYDFNCDGTETKRYTDLADCYGGWYGAANGSNGWYSIVIPVYQSYRSRLWGFRSIVSCVDESCGPIRCVHSRVQTMQQCR